ncbi:class E sortase [Streptomyces albicerus]|uniref:class E sortase n=1 Tax=Streptomyces albicerus TaxID=2569859 RepID=UPI00384AD2CC
MRRAHAEPAHGYAEPQPQPQPQPQPPYAEPPRPYEAQQPSYGGTGAGPRYQEAQPSYGGPPQPSYDEMYARPNARPSSPSYSPPGPPSYEPPPDDDETVALRIAGAEPISGFPTPTTPAVSPTGGTGGTGGPGGGRAARRKAARRHGRHGGAGGTSGAQEERTEPGAPLSRMEARRAARARKPGAAVMASRAIGEVFITTGVLMLLFVTYQLWWTNIRAAAQAGNEASSLQNDWANGKRNPGAFEPGQGFALLHIPKLDVVVPVAEGTDKKRVLDRGMVGHYAEEGVKTAMPDAKTGNFGVAGHRNTHGEPFRYINRLKPGDPIVVETQDKYFVYKMASILPVTAPSNTAVLDAIPKGSGFTAAGRYITLTTCTPEFTSKYRMIVWGTMVEERPRSKGKPDALVG